MNARPAHRRSLLPLAILESLEARTYMSAIPFQVQAAPPRPPMAPLDLFDELGDLGDTGSDTTDTTDTTQPDTTQPDTTQPATEPDQPTPEPPDTGTSDFIDTSDSSDTTPPPIGPILQLEFNSRIVNDGARAGFNQGTYFGTVNFGNSSPTNVLTIRNTGDTDLNLFNIFTTSSDFGLSAPQNFTLNAGDTLSIGLNFTPQDIGPRSGSLVIQSDANNDTQFTVDLAGEGNTLLFDQSYYLRANPDVATAVSRGVFSSALDHFAEYGRYENRAPDAFFVPSFYAAHNTDVAAAVGPGKPFASLFDHFLIYGQEEGRAAGPFYSESLYLQANTDVAAAVRADSFNSGLEHLVAYGQFEGRVFSPFFDQTAYLMANPDVASAVASHAFSSGWDHFIFFGQFEDRSPEGNFNESDYLVKNPDVAAAVADHLFVNGFEHYLLYGRAEGRAV